MGLKISKRSTLKAAKRREEALVKAKTALETENAIVISREEARARQEETILLTKPWRTFECGGGWNTEYRDKLLQDIKSYKYFGELDYSKLVILGQVNAGKSSFISSIASIDKGRIAHVALPGAAEKSYTSEHHQYIPKEILFGKYRLMDTMGIEELDDKGLCIQDIPYLMKGNIAADYEFQPGQPINTQDNPKYIAKPTLKDKPQCIVVVADSNLLDLDAFSDVFKKKLRKLQGFIRQHVVPTAVVLTKVDVVCAKDGIEITDIYQSRRIQTVVTRANQIFGVPALNIFPVQNYHTETHLEDNVDILLLLALKGILNMANDRLERLDDQKH